ncbi:MAG: hypothetical protein CMO55_20855 [Verrucomicrobiales bacterium]|nr:hypothetical protein [Verrucomicrobiales bacterium]
MTIKHQTVFDSDGKPTAALIPWEEFETLRDRLATLDDEQLSPEWKEEIDRRAKEIDEGTVELIDGEDFLNRLRNV